MTQDIDTAGFDTKQKLLGFPTTKTRYDTGVVPPLPGTTVSVAWPSPDTPVGGFGVVAVDTPTGTTMFDYPL